MSDKVSNIAKNTSFFTIALVFQKVVSFAYFTILARSLDPEYLGKYYFAISFAMIFSVIVDMGLANVLLRETAKKQEEASRFLGSVLLIKIPLAFLTMLVIFIFAHFTDMPAASRALVYLASASMIFDSFTAVFFAVIRAFHNLIFESFYSVVFQLIMMMCGLYFLHLGLGLNYLMLAMVAASTFGVLFSLSLVKFRWRINLLSEADRGIARNIVGIAIPFAAFTVLQKLYTYLDSVLLSYLAGDRYVGLYQISFKIIFALQFLPMAFTASLYPAFSLYWQKNREQLAVTFERAINYLVIISLPISVGVISLADKIVLLFKPEYIEAVPSLRIVMLSLVFVFLNFPVGSLLNACDRQKTNSVNMAIALVISIAMNFILIPHWQVAGASTTVFVSNFLMFVIGMYRVPEIITYNGRKNVIVFMKAIGAAVLMSMLVFGLKNYLNIFLIVPLAGIFYFVVLFILGGFRRDDVVSIYQSFFRKK